MSRLPFSLAPLLAALLACTAAAAQSVTVDTGPLAFTAKKDGSGFLDEIKFGGRVVSSFASVGVEPSRAFAAADSAPANAWQAKLVALPDAPCSISRRQSRHGHEEVVLENRYLRVVIVPQIGGRIVELTSKVSGRNLCYDRYHEADLPNLAERVYLGGFEDNIDRSDTAWKTPYKLEIVSEMTDRVAVRVSADVENPGEGGSKLRIERTMSLERDSATLAVDVTYTVLGAPQNVKMMPLCFPSVGEKPDNDDVFYISSRGLTQSLPYVLGSNKDHLFPVGPADGWAALCDLGTGECLLHTFAGNVGEVNIYLGNDSYTLEPYSPALEGRPVGSTSQMHLTYTPCFNLSGVAWVGRDAALQVALERDLLAAREPLRAKVAAIGLRPGAPTKVSLVPAIVGVDAQPRPLKGLELPVSLLAATPVLAEWDVSALPGGNYTLLMELRQGDQKLAEARLPFAKSVSRGCFLELVTPAADVLPGTFSVFGAVERSLVQVTDVRRATKGDDQVVTITGGHQQGKLRTPFVTEITARQGASSLYVRHTVNFGKQLAGRLVQALGLSLPLSLGDDEHFIKTTVGGERINDSWRVDQTDELFPSYLLSDWFPRWPKWRSGGILQESSTHYEAWKASQDDTSPVVTDQGQKAAGWIDVCNAQWGVTARLAGMPQNAPCELFADAEHGVLTIYLRSPHAAPTSAPGGPVTYQVELHFHEGTHPVGVPRELSDERFRELLRVFPQALNIGMDSIGLKAEGTDEEKIGRIILSDVQPSVFLRGLQDWQVRGICEKLGLPYTQDREQDVRAILGRFQAPAAP